MQLLPRTTSGHHPQSQGTVEEEENDMVQFSHVFVCRTAVSLGLAVSALYWLSSDLYEVSWSC